MKQKQQPIFLYTNILLLISVNLIMVTSLILQSSSPRVFAEQALYSCYGVINNLTSSVCTFPNPSTLPAICVAENDPITFTNYFSGDAEILPQSETYSEIVSSGSSIVFPTVQPIAVKLSGQNIWSYLYSNTAPAISASQNNKLLNLSFGVDALLSSLAQGGGFAVPKIVKTSLIQPIRVEHKNTALEVTNTNATVATNTVTLSGTINDLENNPFDLIFEISKDNFATIADTFTLSNQTNGTYSHIFTGITSSAYSYRIKVNEIAASLPKLCSGFANSTTQQPFSALKQGQFQYSSTPTPVAPQPTPQAPAATPPPTTFPTPTPKPAVLPRSGGKVQLGYLLLTLISISISMVYVSFKKDKIKK
jgi:hypothetical protein